MLVDFDEILRHLMLLHRPGERIEIRYRYRKKDGRSHPGADDSKRTKRRPSMRRKCPIARRRLRSGRI